MSTAATTNLDVLRHALAAVSVGDADAFGALFADDYVLEMPFVKPEPLRVEGRAVATEFARQAFQALRIKMTITNVHELTNGDLIAEYTGEGTVLPTGRRFTNHYVGLWRFADGKIASTREWYDTEVAAEVNAELSA
jgi:uncharacterized protein